MDVSRQPIILLDTFLVGNRDRYYNQLIDNLPFMMRDRVYYLPTLFGLRYPWEWLLKFREIAKSDDNMLLKEQWLKWSDYKDAFLGSFILSHSINKIPKWNNIDVSLIIRKEMLMDKGSSSITQSLLITRSFARYRVAGIKLKGVVDWFENQVIDRALALGVRENYPNVKIKGYMGYVAEEYYAGLTPTIYEKQEDLLPDELLMIGEAYIEKKKKKCPWLEVSVAPAFRFHNTMMFESNNITRRSDILLAMPMEIDECRNIINLALSAQLQEKHTWMLKVHPTIPEKKFKEMIPESSNKRFVFTDKSLTDLFESSKLLITSSSSVAIEAVVCGLFVAIIGDRSGPTKNPLLNIVDKSYWSVCYTSNELERVIKNDIQLQKLDKSKYLEKITEKGVIEMMEFS